MHRLRAGRKTRTARPRAKLVRGVRRRLDDARITREVEIVVRREDDELATADDRRRPRRAFKRAALAPEPRSAARFEIGRKPLEAARRICRGRNRRNILDEHRRLLKELDRLCDSVARPAIQEDAPAVRIALLLEDRDPPIAEFARRDISGHVVGIVRHADFGDDAGRVLDLRREDDRLGVVVLYARRSPCNRRGVVHVRRAHAARLVRFKPFERVGVEQHGAAKRMGLGKPRHDFVDTGDSGICQEPRRERPPFGGRRDHMRLHGKRLETKDAFGKRLDLDVYEIRSAAFVRQCTFDEP